MLRARILKLLTLTTNSTKKLHLTTPPGSVAAAAAAELKVPFDNQPFPFTRFEACCPDPNAKPESNGFVPCQSHPIPLVLGKKIEIEEPMKRPSLLRHLVCCVGYDAVEWTRAKVESVPGSIMHTLAMTENNWLKSHRPDEGSGREVMTTVAEREPTTTNSSKPDLLLFPEFKMVRDVDPSVGLFNNESSPDVYPILNSIWQNPNTPVPGLDQLEDLEADTIVLVCTHGRRDLRCGKIGPLLVDEFNKISKEKGLKGKVEVYGTSHFGGHKFAGNVIIHQRGLGGQMYGNVRQCHVSHLFDRHIIHGKVIKELWRGQLTPPSIPV